MPYTMSEVLDSAREELREWARENPPETRYRGDESDRIHEIADGAVPVYHHHLCELAADDFDLMLAEPECGPAYDGTPTPINIIAANVYEAVQAALYEEWRAIEEEEEEAAEERAALEDAEKEAPADG